eukprot:CAMPEP_0117017276 /NCGR_PEP_ID=MMETSP0472-20121206/13516_1 /TAXON_ID=693140 ORGANISM="Tiarina fusus, Strain LIS" /NCGR_SAMPLE_ID=MMETSP0472 /ASSEMBLY_ACC=CAM_ASM_000603 /LENGTH=281 /DNA_ID=CAMNT_0004721603 /DNA_START=672 /DNA_END=1517 /DNA_ORIENTATION=+
MLANYGGLSTLGLTNAFQNEIYILYSLAEIHENIISILGEFTGRPTAQMLDAIDISVRDLYETLNRRTGKKSSIKTKFFVMESHPKTLAQRLRELGDDICRDGLGFKYALQCARALEFLHNHFVMHRDVKPNNILISEEDNIIFTDFGEAVRTDENYLLDRVNIRDGNVCFCSPELYTQLVSKDKILDFKKQASWELGLLMFEIFIGEYPFPGYPWEFMESVTVNVPELDLNSFYPDESTFSAGIDEIIVELLRSEPQQRMDIAVALRRLEHINSDHYKLP